MAEYSTYGSIALRASAATSGANEQDDAVTLPNGITEMWVLLTKTAEANADNLLTARIQSKVGSLWFDVPWAYIHTTQTLTVVDDKNPNVTRTQNIVLSDTTAPTYSVLAYYTEIPSGVVRVASISSGTGAANTFSVTAMFNLDP